MAQPGTSQGGSTAGGQGANPTVQTVHHARPVGAVQQPRPVRATTGKPAQATRLATPHHNGKPIRKQR